MKRVVNILSFFCIFVVDCFCISDTDAFLNWNIRRYTAPDDLPNEIVRDAIMARNGSVWMASWGGGVVVFDGIKKKS